MQCPSHGICCRPVLASGYASVVPFKLAGSVHLSVRSHENHRAKYPPSVAYDIIGSCQCGTSHTRGSTFLPHASGALTSEMGTWLDSSSPQAPCTQPSMLVFSGGTAFNGVVEELKKFTTRVTHVLPVSDDGGSTAEINAPVGGPAVGDIRSRCLRLSDETTCEALAVRRLLGYRLALNNSEAKAEWLQIVEGEHALWNGVSGPYRETIRAFLVHFQSQILKRSYDKFRFGHGSIGNFFFAGARIFFGSLDAAIFLYSRVSQIPKESLVLPAICTNGRLTLGCELYDGTLIRGQNEISHPVVEKLAGEPSHVVNKVMYASPPLPSPIKRIFYMSSEGTNFLHEVFPPVNPTVMEQLTLVNAIVYAMGSFYTSVCPSLVLRGVGETIASRQCPKVFILNGTYDRETKGMAASDFIISLTDALNRKYGGDLDNCLDHPAAAYVSVLFAPRDGEVKMDLDRLTFLGITSVVMVDSLQDESVGVVYDPKALISALEMQLGYSA